MPNPSELARLDAERDESAPRLPRQTAYDAAHKGEIARHLDGDRELHLLLVDIRHEISRINAAAGHTVFNPTLTSMVQERLDN